MVLLWPLLLLGGALPAVSLALFGWLLGLGLCYRAADYVGPFEALLTVLFLHLDGNHHPAPPPLFLSMLHSSPE